MKKTMFFGMPKWAVEGVAAQTAYTNLTARAPEVMNPRIIELKQRVFEFLSDANVELTKEEKKAIEFYHLFKRNKKTGQDIYFIYEGLHQAFLGGYKAGDTSAAENCVDILKQMLALPDTMDSLVNKNAFKESRILEDAIACSRSLRS